jgi:hypothetical protein
MKPVTLSERAQAVDNAASNAILDLGIEKACKAALIRERLWIAMNECLSDLEDLYNE